MFRSDNTSPAHQRVADAVYKAMTTRWGDNHVYGEDPATENLQGVMQSITGRECIVRPVVTGTGANNILIRTLSNAEPGRILCESFAHIRKDEGMAPTLMSGVQLEPVNFGGLFSPPGYWQGIRDYFSSLNEVDSVHGARSIGIIIAQANEQGRAYSNDEISSLCDLAHGHGMFVMVDGARFANAAPTPEDIKIQCRKIDGLSFGASKNGGGDFDAAVLFNPSLGKQFKAAAKSFGHSPAHAYSASSGLLAYLDGGLWHENAQQANAMAALLRQKLEIKDTQGQISSNAVFCHLPGDSVKRLNDLGHYPYDWGGWKYRLMADWTTTAADVEVVAGIILEESRKSGVSHHDVSLSLGRT